MKSYLKEIEESKPWEIIRDIIKLENLAIWSSNIEVKTDEIKNEIIDLFRLDEIEKLEKDFETAKKKNDYSNWEYILSKLEEIELSYSSIIEWLKIYRDILQIYAISIINKNFVPKILNNNEFHPLLNINDMVMKWIIGQLKNVNKKNNLTRYDLYTQIIVKLRNIMHNYDLNK